MTRSRFGAALAFVVAACAVSAAQPRKAPPVVKFKQFGSSPEKFQQSSLAHWTGQLALELEAVRTALSNAKVPPQTRAAVGLYLDEARSATVELDQRIRRGANRDRVFAALEDLDGALSRLAAAANRDPAVRQAVRPPLARAEVAAQQLSAALGAGDNDPARLKRRLVRLSESLDDNAEELRNLTTGNGRALDRALAAYSRQARLLSRRVRDDADADLVRRTYEAMGAHWAEASGVLVATRELPGPVQAQAARVDGLHRRLGAVMNLPPYPEANNPPPVPLGGVFAVGADASAQPRVTVFADEKGTVAHNFFAYDVNFDGGVRVDMADLNGDGVPELITAPGEAKTPVPLPVRVYDGRDMSLLVEFVPFANWKGGLQAVGADLTRDGRALIAVTADGTQHVKFYDLAQGKEVASFFAHDPKVVTGGVRIALGDVNADGVPDLITVNGPGNAPTTVKVFDGKNNAALAQFLVLDEKYRGGGFVAAADVTGNGRANSVVGLDAGTVPLVRVYDLKGKPLVEWLAYDERFRGGVRVAVGAGSRVVTGPGFGHKNSPLRIFHTGKLKEPPVEIVPFPGFDGGLHVGGR